MTKFGTQQFEVMADFNAADYQRIMSNFEKIADRATIKKAIQRAADRAASLGVTATKKKISEMFAISEDTLKKTVKKYKHGKGPHGMAIGVKIRDTARPLSEFNFNPKKHGARPFVEVKRGRGHTLNGPRFVSKTPSTRRFAILERTSKKPYPVRALRGPSSVGMFTANESIHKKVWDQIWSYFEERVVHELHFILDNGGK